VLRPVLVHREQVEPLFRVLLGPQHLQSKHVRRQTFPEANATTYEFTFEWD
jgi:hypothetical protein